jgi:hypothetical protein
MAHFSLQAKEMVHHHTYCTSYYHHDEQIVIVTPSDRFRLRWRSAPVGQEFQPKKRLFEATVGMADKREKQHFKNASSWSSLESKYPAQGYAVAQAT